MKRLIVMVTLVFVLTGCATTKEMAGMAQVSKEAKIGSFPPTRPSMIYVSDFDLEVADIKNDHFARRHRLHFGGLLHRRSDDTDDPAAQARKLVDMMASEIVECLGRKGVPARRLHPGEALPLSGWLIRGVFTEVDEGDRLRRTMIGFGSGATHMNLCLDVSDLVIDAGRPFYNFDTTKGSGNMPGAIISLNPYMAAIGFAINKKSIEKDVKGTAEKIAEQVAGQLKLMGEKGAAGPLI